MMIRPPDAVRKQCEEMGIAGARAALASNAFNEYDALHARTWLEEQEHALRTEQEEIRRAEAERSIRAAESSAQATRESADAARDAAIAAKASARWSIWAAVIALLSLVISVVKG